MKDLKEDFFQGSEYETKTMGTRHTPPVTPIGEGVYAMTTTGRTSHLVYMLTVPQKPGDVQHDMGIPEKGSFITSLKNPTRKGPSNVQLPESPDFPEDILSDFDGRAWMPLQKAEYLDYANAQMLLIGESEEKFEGALEPTDKDRHLEKETPKEELEKLEDEDQIRVEHLHGDEMVFDDLHISKREYPDMMTTW
jgi:uroporphyrinogen-III synthase